MTNFDFQPSTRVIFKKDSLSEAATILNEWRCKKVLVVTDQGLIDAGHVETLLKILKSAKIITYLFSEFSANPTSSEVEVGRKFAAEVAKPDAIIAIGGGSSMDCAKGINILLTNGGEMEDYWGFGKVTQPTLPSIGIPTTAGTGSEAQSFALISRDSDHRKMACGDLKARFKTVVLDPNLLSTVPKDVAIATLLDATSHALESYVSTRANAVSQLYAKKSWDLIKQSGTAYLENPTNVEAAGNLLLAANFSGMSIENSMLGAAHAAANPITATLGLTHGIAVALLLPYVILLNTKKCKSEYLTLNNHEPIEAFSNLIQKWLKFGNYSLKLRDYGVTQSIIPSLAENAATQWTGNFNPIQLNQNDYEKLYQSVL